jgi:hypothetical protein
VIGTVRRPGDDTGGDDAGGDDAGVVVDGQPRAGLPGWDHFA